MTKLLEMFQQGFMINVLAGTMIVAAICSYLGVFIVLRRAVFVGAALAQVSSLGVALALFATGAMEAWQGVHLHLAPQPVALALTVAAAVLMAVQHKEVRLPRETVFDFAVMGTGVCLMLAATFSSLFPAALAVGLLGACAGTSYVTGFTVLQETVQDDLRGRIFATRSTSTISAPAGGWGATG